MTVQTKGIKVNIFGIVKHKRYIARNADIENETWSYRSHYVEKEKLIVSTLLADTSLTVGDHIVIDDVEHKIIKRQFTLNKEEIRYTVDTILETIDDEQSEESKRVAGEQAQIAITRMKREQDDYRRSNSSPLIKKIKRSLFSRVFR